MRGLGSGFIISQAGFILTNAHVVADADEAIIRLATKREFKAKLAGTDPHTDVALRKVGDPGRLEVGEWMAAIGATWWGCRSPFPSISGHG